MIYLDNAATSFPKPDSVYEKIMTVMKEYGANPGRSGHKLAMRSAREIFDVREKICTLFNISNPLQVAFTSNCSTSLNYGIHGILKPGDHVITTSMEHNSVLRPLNFLKDRGVEVTIIKADSEGYVNSNEFKNNIKENTKMFICTHISNLTGTIQPIKEIGMIAKEKDIIFLVDAAQSAGIYDIDVKDMGIDILAVPGHKSLYGPQGTGVLYVNEKIELETIIQGGTGSFSNSIEQPILMPDRFETGTTNAPGIVGLGEGIDFINSIGMDKIREHEENLTFRFIDGLKDVKGLNIYGKKKRGEHAPVVLITLDNATSSEVSEILDSEYDIATRPGLHCAPFAHETLGTFQNGGVRFSFGYYNTEDEVDSAVNAVKEIVKKFEV